MSSWKHEQKHQGRRVVHKILNLYHKCSTDFCYMYILHDALSIQNTSTWLLRAKGDASLHRIILRLLYSYNQIDIKYDFRSHSERILSNQNLTYCALTHVFCPVRVNIRYKISWFPNQTMAFEFWTIESKLQRTFRLMRSSITRYQFLINRQFENISNHYIFFVYEIS